MELYTCSTKGMLQNLKEVLEPENYGLKEAGKKAFSVTEEVSKSGYYWTVLHYSSHYGKLEVL